MPMITSNWAKLLAPGLLGVIDQGFQEPEDQIDMFFRVGTSRRAYEEEFGRTGLRTFVLTQELGETSYDDMLPRYYKKYNMLKYALGTAISEEMYDDDLYGQMSQYGREHGRSARETQQILAFDTFNNAFTAGASAGPDGVALCATNHPKVGGGTQSNRPTVAADLSITSLSQAETDMLNWTDDRGKRIAIKPAVLLVATANKRKSWELTESEYNPEAVERANNYIRSLKLSSKFNQWLTNSKAWFLIGPKQSTWLRWFNRKPFGVRMWEDYDRGALRARGQFRSAVGFSDYIGVWGSPGT